MTSTFYLLVLNVTGLVLYAKSTGDLASHVDLYCKIAAAASFSLSVLWVVFKAGKELREINTEAKTGKK